jgi:CHAD domain-containing protein
MLDDFSADPLPEDVHALRTHARRVEAAIAALAPARSKEPRRVLKLLTRVRKAAGKVRDMDVLIEDALTLKNVKRAEGLVRLVEYLGEMRAKNAKRLREAVFKHRRKTSAHLKQLSKALKKRLEDEPGTLNGGAAPQILVTELSQWPQLNRENLHMFRLRIKELRYMLELSNEPNKQWVKRLGDVKDAIGEWHDWVGLLTIATDVLHPVADAGVLKRIEKTTDERFNAALTTANQMRKRIFQPSQNRNGAYKERRRAAAL